jgi:nucleoside phosphorylase/CheY-like chemotaxis protein
MKILIVEDDPEKLRLVIKAIAANGPLTDDQVVVAHDVRAAKLSLRNESFDLMILDLILPMTPAETPVLDGGLRLLRELQERDGYNVPREVIGLTAQNPIPEETAELFAEDVWAVIGYDLTSESWSDQITRKVKHILLAEKSSTPLAYKCLASIITAIPLELEAVLRLPWSWREFQRANDVTLYYEGTVQAKGKSCQVFAASASRMGMTASAILSTKMIEAFRPEYLIMTGIAAGIKSQCELGDIIVADPTWDWGNGKYSRSDTTSTFAAAPHQIPLHSSVRMKIERIQRHSEELDRVRREWPGDIPATALRILVGPVASGSAVLADPTKLEVIERQHRKLLGIEMEAYGVYASAAEARVPQPQVLSLKSVCDFADEAKGDSLQRYAAYTSAQAMRLFMEQLK